MISSIRKSTLRGDRALFFGSSLRPHGSPPLVSGKALDCPVELPHEMPDSHGEDELAIHDVKNPVPVAGENEELVAVGQVSERAERAGHLREIAFQIVEAAANLLQAETVALEVLDDLELDQIRVRIEPLRAPALRELYRRSDEAPLVPVLDLAQAHPDDAAYRPAIKPSRLHRPAVAMKTSMFS